MEHSKRLELFEKARARYSVFLTSVLWKLTADREIFTEAMQYALFAMWRHRGRTKGTRKLTTAGNDSATTKAEPT